jgi:hypothetical protein
MNTSSKKLEDQKTKVIEQVAELSRLLGMIPSDDTIILREPLTQKSILISDWLSTRLTTHDKQDGSPDVY